MKKLRFKNRNGVLYFGVDGKFKSSKMKYNTVNKNILIGKFNRGEIDDELSFCDEKTSFVTDLVSQVVENKSKHLKHKTMIAYRSSYSNHIVPYFKGKTASEIKPLHIKEFQDAMVDRGLKKESVQFARILLKEAFENAVLNEHIQSNPVDAVSMPKIKYKKEKPKPFTLDEIDLILESAKGQLKNFLGISFFTGMRSGELLALTWDDLDFTENTITINKTVAQGIINSAKTRSSERDIEMLDKCREFFKSQRLVTGLKNSYVFLNAKGNHYSSNDYFYGKYQALLESLNIEKRALHNTRHSFASIMLNNKVDTLWVSHTLGHENLQITLSIYTHFMPKKEKMRLHFLEKRYKNGTEA
ncbi:tyrosine-type recombinase/integrase [Sulfurimonas sp. HSL-1716]|uniref:tyrosine-type recombinase/integrase n=1 Tax=Hydrocurvibacter sulfurireducens TaxID=3131937 RepID=UPI0031F8BAA9